MKRTRMEGIPAALPPALLPLATGVAVYDSSSSREAQVYLIDRDGGYYLKIAQKGALAREAQMAAYFHKKGLGPAVAAYISEESDFLLTARLAGEDATHARYLSDPRRLCDRMAEELRALHELSCADCPVTNRTADYLALAERNYRAGRHDPSLFPDGCGYRSAEEAYTVLQEGKGALRCEVLLHGDYCLPNILFDGWRLSGFVDVGCGGVGDRHIDLFWGAWTLRFNLKTDRYRDRFFDAYGRDCVDGALLRTVAAAELFG